MTAIQLAMERVITKTFKHYSITLDITENIRTTFKSKLWRMGKRINTVGGTKQKKELLLNWKEGRESIWNLTINESEVCRQIFARKRLAEVQLEQERIKTQKLEAEVKDLKEKTKAQGSVISRLSFKTKRRSTSKQWRQYSRQQKSKIKKRLATSVKETLEIICESEKYKVEMENVDTNTKEILDVENGTLTKVDESSCTNALFSTLLVKDKFGISNAAYHELSMVNPQLPKSCQVEKLIRDLNSKLVITNTPNDTNGVQLSLITCVKACLSNLVPTTKDTNRTVRIKLTGDGTLIARGLNVIMFAFSILEKDLNPTSVQGNHPIAILKTSENYKTLSDGLQDIIQEAENLKRIEVDGISFDIELFLGGDWKFLAMICGIDSASSTYSCIWCKCPNYERWDTSKTWSLLNTKNGARTIAEISKNSKLPKSNKNKFNCSHDPLFPFIPLDHVVIDTLHLFLRIADILINLLICDLRALDATTNSELVSNLTTYKKFLNEKCKIHINWITSDKTLKWRDLTGPEKHRLFKNMNIIV